MSENAATFLTKSANQISVFLFFGSDPGLVSERCNLTVKLIGVDTHDPFHFIRLDAADIAGESARLLDETNTVGLFGSTRAIRIDLGSVDLAPALEAALQNAHTDWKIIIEAGALKKESNVRRLCERHRSAVAIECNQDRVSDLASLLDSSLTSAGFSIASDAREYFLASLGSDRLNTRAEMDKLTLFAHGGEQISIDDIVSLVADTSNLALDETVNLAFSGDMSGLEESWKRLSAGGVDGSTLLGAALREAIALHQYFGSDRGGSAGAEQRYNRGYGRKPLSPENLRKWSLGAAAYAVEVLSAAVQRARLEANLSQEIGMRALWTIAFLIRA